MPVLLEARGRCGVDARLDFARACNLRFVGPVDDGPAGKCQGTAGPGARALVAELEQFDPALGWAFAYDVAWKRRDGE